MRIRAPSTNRGNASWTSRERREHVDPVDALELVERIVCERWLGAWAQHARVVDEHVDPLPGGCDQLASVIGVRDVACDRDHCGQAIELGGRAFQVLGVARIEHQRPPALGERARERKPETSRCTRDD